MKAAALRILEGNSNSWGHENIGREITFFEEEFAAYCGRKYAVMLNSCLNSIFLLLKLQGISPGDELITQPNIEPGDVTVAVQAGAKPVLADIDPDTLNIDPNQVAAKITEKTKVILPKPVSAICVCAAVINSGCLYPRVCDEVKKVIYRSPSRSVK